MARDLADRRASARSSRPSLEPKSAPVHPRVEAGQQKIPRGACQLSRRIPYKGGEDDISCPPGAGGSQPCPNARPARAVAPSCPRVLRVTSAHAASCGQDWGATRRASPATAGPPRLAQASASWTRSPPRSAAVPHVLLRDTAPGEEPGPIVRPTGGDDADPSIRYRIDGEIARGGMGAVLKGRDPDLGRDVAVKVLLEDHPRQPRHGPPVRRGGPDRRPAPAPRHRADLRAGHLRRPRPFFAMKLVKGHTLADTAGDTRSDPADGLPRFLSIFEAICQTVAYAHARGVIHRDLKPSNVMVGSFGEVQVMDWGLAKVLPRGGVVDDAQAGKTDRQETVIATARSGSGLRPLARRLGDGHASLHGPRAGPGRDRPGRRAGRRLRAGLDPLRDPHRQAGRSSAAIAGEIQRKAARGDLADALRPARRLRGRRRARRALAKDCLAREPEDRPRDAGAVARADHGLPGRRAGAAATCRAAAGAMARGPRPPRSGQRRAADQLGLAASRAGADDARRAGGDLPGSSSGRRARHGSTCWPRRAAAARRGVAPGRGPGPRRCARDGGERDTPSRGRCRGTDA